MMVLLMSVIGSHNHRHLNALAFFVMHWSRLTQGSYFSIFGACCFRRGHSLATIWPQIGFWLKKQGELKFSGWV